MTVKELRDKLDNYIKRDPPDTWQLNDCDADAKAYADRCAEREARKVVIVDDGMKAKFFDIDSAFGMAMPKRGLTDKACYFMKDVFALCTDLTNEIE